ncbi:MAG: GntR family transcriptional regulator [Planctomycetes bacterium]|nr:GntR family transcriptional regulator [Planctomycetota bacterium]
MIIRIDPTSPEPLFEQVVFAVKASVAKGSAQAGEKLPSVRELARELAINPNTVVRAYEALERDGVIVRRQGAGCFLTGRGAGSELATAERRRQLRESLRRAATEAVLLGFSPDEIEQELRRCLNGLNFDQKESKS